MVFENHLFWYDDVRFDENVEFSYTPKPVGGRDILAMLEATTCTYAKGRNQTAKVDEKDEVQILKKEHLF